MILATKLIGPQKPVSNVLAGQSEVPSNHREYFTTILMLRQKSEAR